jgi:hypothetical protein
MNIYIILVWVKTVVYKPLTLQVLIRNKVVRSIICNAIIITVWYFTKLGGKM